MNTDWKCAWKDKVRLDLSGTEDSPSYGARLSSVVVTQGFRRFLGAEAGAGRVWDVRALPSKRSMVGPGNRAAESPPPI